MIYTKLREHQVRIADYMIRHVQCGVFADYGTGKTLCFLDLVEKKKWHHVLIVSTKLGINTTWVDEIRKRTDFRYVVLIGARRQKMKLLDRAVQMSVTGRGYYHSRTNNPTCFLINYDGVKNIYHELLQVHFDAIVLDESTKIKDINSTRTQVLCAFGLTIKNRSIMTGFPITEQLSDVYSQIKFLDGGKALGSNYYRFINTYFVKMGQKLVIKRQSQKKILELISPFCIRVSNKSLRLPPKVYKHIQVEQTPQQKKLFQELNESFSLEFGKVKYDTQYIFALITKSLQICDGFVTDQKGNLAIIPTEKDESLLEILNDINVRKNKIVIWAHFLFSVKKIKRILTRLKVPSLVMTGETQNENLVVKTFQNSPTTHVLIATQKKAAESITLTSCKYALYYSSAWSGDLRVNSEARIRRMGSEKHSSIMYIDLTTRGGVDERVYECLQKKKRLIDDLKKLFSKMGGADHVVA